MNATLRARDSTTDPIGVGVLPFPKPQNLGIEWDAENRLLAVNQGTLRSEFVYDGKNRRVRIVEKDNGAVTSDSRFLWCDGRICEQRDSTGSTVERRFFDRGVTEGPDKLFYAVDHVRSVRELTDMTGNVQARYEFDPFGRWSKISGTRDSMFGFAGHFVHYSTELFLSRSRAYDAAMGRWISPDPIGLRDGPNLYRYVLNNPTTYTDPTGLAVITPSCTGLFRRRIEEAIEEIERAIDGGCLPCDQDANKWKDTLDKTSIHCVEGSAACAFAGTPGGVPSPVDITVWGSGVFSPDDCGCLPGLLTHELAHNVTEYGGHDLSDPNSPDILASLCFSCSKPSPDAR